MIQFIFAILGGFCLTVMATFGYGGIVLLMGIESACIPLPSELIMPYAGALSHADVHAELSRQFGLALPQFHLFGAAVAGAIGCNVGSELAYWIGYKGGRASIERYGKYILLSKHELAIADRWFAKHGELIVLVARLLPILRTFIAFPAGVARMNRVTFHVYTFLGSLPWCWGLAKVGERLGLTLLDDHSPLKQVMHRFDLAIGCTLLGAALWFVSTKLRTLRSSS